MNGSRPFDHRHHPGPRRLSPADIDAIKAAHPIEHVVAAYDVTLRRVGATLVALCPLHRETHPSFTIYPEAQRFYCYGCRQGGDVIELVQQVERVGFLEAIERLHGLHQSSGRSASGSVSTAHSRTALTDLAQRALAAHASPTGQATLDLASWLYHRALLDTPAAQAYLARRGIGREVATRCRLGYCLGTQLLGALRQHGLPPGAAWAVGLLIGPEGRERFAGRITIPELRGGRAVWLTGRLVNETQDAPRYMSLPGPRPLLGAEHAAGREPSIGVEGAFDWLTLVAWGLPGFAALGGSLAQEAPTVLSQASSIYLAFDRDPPGQRAAQLVAARLGGRARLVTLPDGIKDVNELGQRPDGAARFRECLHRATSPMQATSSPPEDTDQEREVA